MNMTIGRAIAIVNSNQPWVYTAKEIAAAQAVVRESSQEQG